MKPTGIICTIGPACQSPKVLRDLISAGMSIARLNFSHDTHARHLKNLQTIRRLAKIPVIQDLQGLKIRVAELKLPLPVKPGKVIAVGKDFRLDHDISGFVKPGQSFFIEDGLLEFEVVKVHEGKVFCKAKNSGEIKSRKGVNFPQSKIPLKGLTKKDREDLLFGLNYNFDYVALSFVRSKEDILEVKKIIGENLLAKAKRPKIIAKIEKPEALKNIDAIIEASDMVMVARGDLGIEVEVARLPLIQKEIIKKCVKAKKPVIVATQMMDSMIIRPRPTRAEVSDVANAVLDGADFCMLSGETAIGSFPAEAVRQMAGVIAVVEKFKE